MKTGAAESTTVAPATGLTEWHEELLEKRGINTELAVNLGWRSAPEAGNGDWIEIPFYRDGKIVNRKYRTISGEKKFYQSEGGDQCFWNLDAVRDASRDVPLVITEGEMDAVIALQCGYLAVSVPCGAPGKPVSDPDSPRYGFLKDLPRDIPVVLAVDGDEAGAALLHDLSVRIGRHKCKWVKYPKECKDLNDAFLRYGRRGVDAAIKRAEWMPVPGVYRMSQLPPAPAFEALSCGVHGMEEHYLLRPADLAVITGIPSSGKTILVNEIVCNMAKLHGWKGAVASFEQRAKPDYQRYIRTYYTGIYAGNLAESDPRLVEADKWIDENFVFIVTDMESDQVFDIEWLLERCQQAVLQEGVKLIVLDPWNEVDHQRQPGMKETDYVGDAIKQIKRFAMKYLVHFIIVAHPAKMEKNKEGGYGIPTLYDVSGSANWYNKPEIGIVVFRTPSDITVARIAKCRYEGIIGRRGDVYMKYESTCARFVHMTEEEVAEHLDRFEATEEGKTGKLSDNGTPKKKRASRKKKSLWDDIEELPQDYKTAASGGDK